MTNTEPLSQQQQALMDELVRIGNRVGCGEISEAEAIAQSDAIMERFQLQVGAEVEGTMRQRNMATRRRALIKLALLVAAVVALWVLSRVLAPR